MASHSSQVATFLTIFGVIKNFVSRRIKTRTRRVVDTTRQQVFTLLRRCSFPMNAVVWLYLQFRDQMI
jgi:hypothetical protein